MRRGAWLVAWALAAAWPATGAAQGYLTDSDQDLVPDLQDVFPCDAAASGELFAPAQGVWGMLQFEDFFPTGFDEDFNDVVVAYNYQLSADAGGQVTAVRAVFHVLALGGRLEHGMSLALPVPRAAVSGATITIGGSSAPASASTLDGQWTTVLSPQLRSDLFQTAQPILNADPAVAQVSSTPIVLEVQLATPQALDVGAAPFDVFVFRSDDPTHEIHRTPYCGSARMNAGLFGQGVDGSNAPGGPCFRDTNGLPWVLEMPQTVAYPLEEQPIAQLYPRILSFAASGGAADADFYLSPVTAHAYSMPVTPAFPGQQDTLPKDVSCLPTRKSVVRLASGSGTQQSAGHTLRLIVGGPVAHGASNSAQNSLQMGPIVEGGPAPTP